MIKKRIRRVRDGQGVFRDIIRESWEILFLKLSRNPVLRCNALDLRKHASCLRGLGLSVGWVPQTSTRYRFYPTHQPSLHPLSCNWSVFRVQSLPLFVSVVH